MSEPRGEDSPHEPLPSDSPAEDDFPDPEPVELAVTDILDLHSFPPSEIRALVRDYLDLACEAGIYELRIIHGKGIGVQRRSVRSLLERDPRVVSYGDAPGDGGSWGATLVKLQPPGQPPPAKDGG